MKIISKLIALAVLLSAISSQAFVAQTNTFGTALGGVDGLSGFTHTDVNGSNIYLTANSGSVQYGNHSSGFENSSFLKDMDILRQTGRSYTISAEVTLTDGYADDNNRVGIYLFGDSAQVPNENEAGALSIIWNLDDGSQYGSPGNNSVDIFEIRDGIDGVNVHAFVRRNQSTPYAQDLFGTTVTFGAEFIFADNGTDLHVRGSLTDSGGVTTTDWVTLNAADYAGDYFGFITRARSRDYVEGGTNSAEGRSLPWTVDYESFSIVPEPATVGMFGVFGAALLFIRRRARRWRA